ncbi:MAG: helix-turn-helix domain-containing protein [Patescibacteria group bacterium]
MNDKLLLKQLEKFGFLPTQAKLYLAGVRLGPALMTTLARQAGIKRTTAYYVIGELKRRGFFTVVKIGKRPGYKAVAPKNLLLIIQKREKLVRKLLSYLS